MTNIFLKTIYRLTEKTIVDINESNKANFEKGDQIITWIVGFSIGILVLILPKDNIESLKDLYGTTYYLLNLALLVIFFWLLYRIFSFITNLVNSTILNDLSGFTRGFTANLDEIPIARSLSGNETTIQIAQYLKEDFNYVAPYKIEQDDPQLTSLMVNYYKILADSNDVDKQLSDFKIQIGKYFGLSQKYIEFFTKEKTIIIRGSVYLYLTILTSLLFITTIGIFIFGALNLLMILNNFPN